MILKGLAARTVEEVAQLKSLLQLHMVNYELKAVAQVLSVVSSSTDFLLASCYVETTHELMVAHWNNCLSNPFLQYQQQPQGPYAPSE